MKTDRAQMRTTIVYGFICALGVIPSLYFLEYLEMIVRIDGLRFMIWIYLSGYLLLLRSFREIAYRTLLFPVILPLPAVFLNCGNTPFFITVLMVLSWVRSGTDISVRVFYPLMKEILLCIGGAALILLLRPVSLSGVALGIWLFFLIQSLYFILPGGRNLDTNHYHSMDAFEKARRHAENILSEDGVEG